MFDQGEIESTKGLYLAGVEVKDDAQPPEGWVKWNIPSYEYIYVKIEGPSTFLDMLKYINQNNRQLAGSVHEFHCPETGQVYLFFPIRRLEV